VAYTQSHIAHLNTKGRNFYSDHKLLEKVYEFLQEDVDIIGEKIRTVRGNTCESVNEIINHSSIMDYTIAGTADQLLKQVDEAIETLIEEYHRVYEEAEVVQYIDISNFAQDQIGQLAKLRWMLESTLDERKEE
jgi:DNA-binding ferritin-like protein